MRVRDAVQSWASNPFSYHLVPDLQCLTDMLHGSRTIQRRCGLHLRDKRVIASCLNRRALAAERRLEFLAVSAIYSFRECLGRESAMAGRGTGSGTWAVTCGVPWGVPWVLTWAVTSTGFGVRTSH